MECRLGWHRQILGCGCRWRTCGAKADRQSASLFGPVAVFVFIVVHDTTACLRSHGSFTGSVRLPRCCVQCGASYVRRPCGTSKCCESSPSIGTSVCLGCVRRPDQSVGCALAKASTFCSLGAREYFVEVAAHGFVQATTHKGARPRLDSRWQHTCIRG